MELAVDDFAACGYDCIRDVWLKRTEFLVCLGCGKFDACHRYDILRIVAHPRVGNLIIVEGSLCLHTVVGLSRNLKFSKKIRLDSEFLFAHNELIFSVYKLFYNLSDKGNLKKDYKQNCREKFQIIICYPAVRSAEL